MKNTQVSLRRLLTPSGGPMSQSSRPSSLKELLAELAEVLHAMKQAPVTASQRAAVERWEDDDYIYLETDLEGARETEIDINLHDGRFYIRVER